MSQTRPGGNGPHLPNKRKSRPPVTSGGLPVTPTSRTGPANAINPISTQPSADDSRVATDPTTRAHRKQRLENPAAASQSTGVEAGARPAAGAGGEPSAGAGPSSRARPPRRKVVPPSSANFDDLCWTTENLEQLLYDSYEGEELPPELQDQQTSNISDRPSSSLNSQPPVPPPQGATRTPTQLRSALPLPMRPGTQLPGVSGTFALSMASPGPRGRQVWLGSKDALHLYADFELATTFRPGTMLIVGEKEIRPTQPGGQLAMTKHAMRRKGAEPICPLARLGSIDGLHLYTEQAVEMGQGKAFTVLRCEPGFIPASGIFHVVDQPGLPGRAGRTFRAMQAGPSNRGAQANPRAQASPNTQAGLHSRVDPRAQITPQAQAGSAAGTPSDTQAGAGAPITSGAQASLAARAISRARTPPAAPAARVQVPEGTQNYAVLFPNEPTYVHLQLAALANNRTGYGFTRGSPDHRLRMVTALNSGGTNAEIAAALGRHAVRDVKYLMDCLRRLGFPPLNDRHRPQGHL